MSNCSLAIQILPQQTDQATVLKIVDRVIDYLRANAKSIEVSAFETTIEGNFDELMLLLKGAIEVAGSQHHKIFTNVKISYDAEGQVLGIDEKVSKHRQ